MSNQTTGYVQVVDGELNNVDFVPSEDDKYMIKYSPIERKKIFTLKK